MKLRKGIALVLSFILILSISFPSISNAKTNKNDEFTILVNNSKKLQIKAERDGVKAILKFDKETNELSLNTNEKSNKSGKNNRDYKIDVKTATDEKIEATFIDIETGEEYSINTDELQASFAFLLPLGVVIGETLLAHLVAAGLAITIAGVTYAAATEVIEKLNKEKHNHYAAKLKSNVLYIGNNVSLSTAASLLKSGEDVWSKSGDLAAKVAREAGGGRPAVPSENHWDKGLKKHRYYNHYHIYNRSGGHSFYGAGRLGAK